MRRLSDTGRRHCRSAVCRLRWKGAGRTGRSKGWQTWLGMWRPSPGALFFLNGDHQAGHQPWPQVLRATPHELDSIDTGTRACLLALFLTRARVPFAWPLCVAAQQMAKHINNGRNNETTAPRQPCCPSCRDNTMCHGPRLYLFVRTCVRAQTKTI